MDGLPLHDAARLRLHQGHSLRPCRPTVRAGGRNGREGGAGYHACCSAAACNAVLQHGVSCCNASAVSAVHAEPSLWQRRAWLSKPGAIDIIVQQLLHDACCKPCGACCMAARWILPSQSDARRGRQRVLVVLFHLGCDDPLRSRHLILVAADSFARARTHARPRAHARHMGHCLSVHGCCTHTHCRKPPTTRVLHRQPQAYPHCQSHAVQSRCCAQWVAGGAGCLRRRVLRGTQGPRESSAVFYGALC